jgi:hypothetical protein
MLRLDLVLDLSGWRDLNPGPLRPEATSVGLLAWEGVPVTCADGQQTSVLVRGCSSALSRS